MATSTYSSYGFQKVFSSKVFWYVVALLLRLLIAAVFFDKGDCPAFIETAENILVLHRPLYYEPTIYNDFVYPPLAYIAILPGMALYYLLGLNNLVLERIFLKLPIILGDLWLAYLFRRTFIPLYKAKEDREIKQYSSLSWPELILLFNPFLIYSSAVKAQFFNLSVICLIYSWRAYQKEQDIIAGVWAAAAILIKQYSVLFALFLGWALLKKSLKRTTKLLLGAIIITVPILAIGAVSNFQGMMEKTILFNISKEPAGYSITSMLYSWLSFFGETYNINFLVVLAKSITYLGTGLLLGAFIYLAYNLWKEELTDERILKTIILSFLLTFVLNKQFWLHYLPVIIALWLEYKHMKQERIGDIFLAWNYALIPLILIVRITNMLPTDVSDLIGLYGVAAIVLGGLILHFVILIIMSLKNYLLFSNKKMKVSYIVIIIALTIGLAINVFLEQIATLIGLEL